MSYKPEQLLVLTNNFEKLAAESLKKSDKKKSKDSDKKDSKKDSKNDSKSDSKKKDSKKSSKKKASEYYDNILEKNAQSTWSKYNPFSKENNKGLEKLNPFKTPVAPPPPGGYGLVQPPAPLPAEEDTSTPPYAFPKTMNAPAEREEDMIGPPVAPKAAPGKSYSVAPEVMSFQNYLVQQGKGDLLGPAGADGKLGPKTIAALQQFYPGLSPQAALQSFFQAAQSGVFTPPKAALPPLPAPTPAAAPKPTITPSNQAYDPFAQPTPKAAPKAAPSTVKYPWGNPYAPAAPKPPQPKTRGQQWTEKNVKHPWSADDGQTTAASFADEFFKKLS